MVGGRALCDEWDPEADLCAGILTIALLEAMAESCIKGLPVKAKEVLARHGLDELFNPGNP
jgi:hypothetical protein